MQRSAMHKAIRLFGPQRILAEKIGVSRQMINMYLNGLQEIPWDKAVSIVDVCKKENPSIDITAAQLQPEIPRVEGDSDRKVSQKPLIYRGEILISQLRGWQAPAFHNLKEAADYVRQLGLLDAVVITSDREVICGAELICVCKQKGCKKVPVKSVDLDAILADKHCRYELKKNFKSSERVHIGERLRRLIDVRQGARTDLQLHQDPDEVKSKKQTSDRISDLLGFGNRTSYSEACRIVRHGIPVVVCAWDNKDVTISQALLLSKMHPEAQHKKLKQFFRAGRKDLVKKYFGISNQRVEPIPAFMFFNLGWRV